MAATSQTQPQTFSLFALVEQVRSNYLYQKSKMEAMTLEQKVGQLMLVGFDGTTVTPEFRAVIQELRIGGVIFYDRNVASPQQVAQLNADLQTAARANGDRTIWSRWPTRRRISRSTARIRRCLTHSRRY
jgi:hypothetical protein